MVQEAILIKEFSNGNKKAFEELVNMYYHDVYRLCCYYVKDKTEAYDLTQDIFILLYKKLNSFRGDAPFKAWFFKIVYNKCMEFVRRRAPVKKMSEIQKEDDDSDEVLENFATDTEGGNRYSPHLKSVMTYTLNELPEKSRTILELFYYSNFSCAEIAHILDMSEGAVRTALCRARNTLKEKLQLLQR